MKLIMCQGLPASGKSTWAYSQKGFTVINSDEIRETMGGFNQDMESLVQDEKLNRIRIALKQGKSVISDDPNLTTIVQNKLRALARRFNATFEIKLFDTSIDECIRRDSLRDKCVGEAAIRKYIRS